MEIKKKYLLVIFAFITAHTLFAQQKNIQVLSATVKDKRIENAEVLLQKNGSQSIVGYTNGDGRVSLTTSFADDINATIIIKKEGYSTLVAKCPCNNLTYAISPTMQNLDGMRIVLSWGENPSDLDAHLAYAGDHIYFRNQTGSNANLDVDDTDSYGPETITIEQKNIGQEYVFAVHDYSDSDNPNTLQLSNSQAKVFVYIGESLVRTYYITPNIAGNLWTVFKINANGEMEDINTMNRINLDAANVKTIMQHPHDAIVMDNNYDVVTAKHWNLLGDRAYTAKDYATSIEYFNNAIQEDPNYGQAYGNLALSYKRMGRNAEAIWANRKAITLTSGATASTVKAGSYYNIGRIYEEKGQFANALNMYKIAKSLKENVVYDNAIKRMLAKGLLY